MEKWLKRAGRERHMAHHMFKARLYHSLCLTPTVSNSLWTQWWAEWRTWRGRWATGFVLQASIGCRSFQSHLSQRVVQLEDIHHSRYTTTAHHITPQPLHTKTARTTNMGQYCRQDSNGRGPVMWAYVSHLTRRRRLSLSHQVAFSPHLHLNHHTTSHHITPPQRQTN